MANSKTGKSVPIDSGSDSEGGPSNQQKKRQFMSPTSGNKVTFDYKGKLMQVKDPNLAAVTKTINPDVYIKGMHGS